MVDYAKSFLKKVKLIASKREEKIAFLEFFGISRKLFFVCGKFSLRGNIKGSSCNIWQQPIDTVLLPDCEAKFRTYKKKHREKKF